jgi:hypothetical protein
MLTFANEENIFKNVFIKKIKEPEETERLIDQD